MGSKNNKLRSGYTTGACAAAAAKAATILLLQGQGSAVKDVEIPFPDGSRHAFKIQTTEYRIQNGSPIAMASVIKDAGDDPDITNGAEIVASARTIAGGNDGVVLKGGKGVGTVTKPGLSVPVGEPAINPVPRKMIRQAVAEAVTLYEMPDSNNIEITIEVSGGEELATKTLNARLGIIGGISILGTSGIVRPLSAEAWTASITAAMDVAVAMGCGEIVLSTGRVSEKAHMKRFSLPVESYLMMGDYVEFSLIDAKKHNFNKIHLSAHWAKILKIAMRIPHTHVRHGAIDLHQTTLFLNNLTPGLLDPAYDFNTARQMYDEINSKLGARSNELLSMVCVKAKEYAEDITAGISVIAHLVSYEGEIIADSE
ncbi:MAG: cobalt-precorrin-5B (C(1))-methyltransferase [Nitrospirota bacterium]|nr:cobalt-precorrin-5B (C(1))-methyltransferase [Nitrospirota bacterium]